MRPKFKKLEVTDIRDLEKLVTENAESIEPGLRIIDSCLLLGHARVDLVGLDAKNSLVLITLDFTATEDMLLRALEAYSWCLEYPETVRRLYPKSRFKSERPPRVLFIAERLPDAFLRKARQLNFPSLDCLTCLHLEVDGAPAVYFEVVERIRRATDESPESDAIVPDLAMDQHPFIEGTPPEQSWDRPDSNAAWQARLAAEARLAATEEAASLAPSTRERERSSRKDGLTRFEPDAAREADVLDTAIVEPEFPGATPSLDDSILAQPDDPTSAESFEQYKGEWQEFLDRLGASKLPPNGKLSRESEGFLKQFGPSE
ncbi:MAG TPA: hypothetical protein VGW35_08340 [Methylomirabilota bacterium]|nr:hypothetical protein [Methylomirabilota bacterium]